MDVPRGDFYGGYSHGGPNFPQNDPQYNNYNEPRPPHFNGPDPNFNYNNRQQPMTNAPNDLFPAGGGSWPGRNNGGTGNSGNFPSRKRGWHAHRHGPTDQVDGLAKLYVASVPRTATEEDIRPVFEQHGRVVEVVLLKDKKTGQQQGSCFVKFGTREEADRAIRALNDNFTFQGEAFPVKVRYADGTRERLGGHWAAPPSAVKAENHGGQWGAPPSAIKCDNHGGQWVAPPSNVNGDNHAGGQWATPTSFIGGDNPGAQWTGPPSGFKGNNHGGQWTAPPVVIGDNQGGPGAPVPSTAKTDSYGTPADKLYVGGISKLASKKDIEDIFSPYGVVEDVFIARDELKQNRCAFIKYSQRDMALAAINALNETFTMRGCDLPLVVRFAIPKKPRHGEPRSVPAPNPGDSVGGFRLPNSAHSVHHTTATPLLPPVNQLIVDPRNLSQPFPPLQQPSQLCQGSLPQIETPETYRLSQPLASDSWKQLDITQKPNQNAMQQQISQAPQSGIDPQRAASTSAASTVTENAEVLECDWSQHICPDGHKYYYNCVTCESAWEKPDDYAKYELELENQQKQQHTGQILNPASSISIKQVAQTQNLQLQNSIFHQENVKAEAGLAIVPACG